MTLTFSYNCSKEERLISLGLQYQNRLDILHLVVWVVNDCSVSANGKVGRGARIYFWGIKVLWPSKGNTRAIKILTVEWSAAAAGTETVRVSWCSGGGGPGSLKSKSTRLTRPQPRLHSALDQSIKPFPSENYWRKRRGQEDSWQGRCNWYEVLYTRHSGQNNYQWPTTLEADGNR